MIKSLSGFAANTLAFECSGHVTRADYDTVLKPAVESALKDHKKLNLFYKIGSDFSGFQPGAVWEDFAIGMSHLLSWGRIAVVTDVDWITHSVNAFGFLMPAKVEVFKLADEAAARDWIAA